MSLSRWNLAPHIRTRASGLAAAALLAAGLASPALAQSAPDDYYDSRPVRAIRQPVDDRQGFQPPRREGEDARPAPRMEGERGAPRQEMRERIEKRMESMTPEDRERIKQRMEQMRERMQAMRERGPSRDMMDRGRPQDDRRPMSRDSFRGDDRRDDDRAERSGPGRRPMMGGPDRGPDHDMGRGFDRGQDHSARGDRPMPPMARGRDHGNEHFRGGPDHMSRGGHDDRGRAGRGHPHPGMPGPMGRPGPMHRDDDRQGGHERGGRGHERMDKKHPDHRDFGSGKHNAGKGDRGPRHDMKQRDPARDDRRGPDSRGGDRRGPDRRDDDRPRRGAQDDAPWFDAPTDPA